MIISPRFYNYSCAHSTRCNKSSWHLLTSSSTSHSVFPLPPTSMSAGHDSLQEGSGSFLVLPRLNYYNFPLTLIIGHDNTRHNLRDLLYSRHTPPYLYCGVVVQFHLTSLNQSPQPRL